MAAGPFAQFLAWFLVWLLIWLLMRLGDPTILHNLALSSLPPSRLFLPLALDPPLASSSLPSLVSLLIPISTFTVQALLFLPCQLPSQSLYNSPIPSAVISHYNPILLFKVSVPRGDRSSDPSHLSHSCPLNSISVMDFLWLGLPSPGLPLSVPSL